MNAPVTIISYSNDLVKIKASGNPHVSIILPTFNESKNVVELLRLINLTMVTANLSYECVFVDDSFDNTPEVIMKAAESYPGLITFVKRTGSNAKTGLTMAFKRGFMEARGQVIVCMDTDLQHPPATIEKLVQKVDENNCDVVVASRYTKGGSAEGLNGFFRKFVSRASNMYVWTLLPATRNTTDPMTGFFAFNKNLLSKIEFSSLGFKILVELLAALDKPKVVDIPFSFQKRKEEESKATLMQGVVVYRDIFGLFLTESRGSVLVKAMIVASVVTYAYIIGLLFTMLSSSFSNTFLEQLSSITNLSSNVFAEIALGALISLGTFGMFRFALAKYSYNKLIMKNIVLVIGFAGAVFYTFKNLVALNNLSIAHSLLLFITFLGSFFVFQVGIWLRKHNILKIETAMFALVMIFILSLFTYFLNFGIWWNSVLLVIYFLVVAQGLFALYLMIYAWENEDNTKAGKSDGTFADPKFSFTAIVPCKHEKNTIADTIRAMNLLQYPADKKQIIVVIHQGTDDGTINIVNETIRELGVSNIQLVTYNESPVNKPHGLNKALAQATGDFVAIFDAEDEPHADLLHVVNTALIETNADVMQSGVQLMNYDSNWYSIFNVLEYYFWFKSSLHFYAKSQVAPLGGVSVFFRRAMLQKVGGWDMSCLTEDAEVGIRLSQMGAKVSVIYNAEYATREETPPTLISFVKQRTRWAQGFLQILARGSFKKFPTFKQRFLALYILSWPLIIPFAALLLPFGIIMMEYVTLPPALALLSNVPLLLFLGFLITLIIGFYEFTREYKCKFSLYYVFVIIIFFYPYTLLLVIASIRAIYRNIANITVWEKTEHINKHREGKVSVLEASLPIAARE